MNCPDCGTDMGVGYSVGDLCTDCYELGCTADDIIDALNKVCPAVCMISTTTKVEVRDVIKAILREHFPS